MSENHAAPPRALPLPEVAVDECEHHWVSSHEPGHIVYWVRQCSLCHRVHWDDLDAEIRASVAGLLLAAGTSSVTPVSGQEEQSSLDGGYHTG